MHELEIITALSHEFGTPDFVIGGGGNTSFKNAETLWVKPSGTTLANGRATSCSSNQSPRACSASRATLSWRLPPPARDS